MVEAAGIRHVGGPTSRDMVAGAHGAAHTCTWTHTKTGIVLSAIWASACWNGEKSTTHGGRHLACTSTADPHAKGANVVPPFPRGPFRRGLAQHCRQRRPQNMNMVRVWGGGVYPPDAFFNACDREGSWCGRTSCLHAPWCRTTGASRRTSWQKPRNMSNGWRHHPSLALWCGNNEVERAWTSWGWQDMYNLHGPGQRALGRSVPTPVP